MLIENRDDQGKPRQGPICNKKVLLFERSFEMKICVCREDNNIHLSKNSV